MLIPDRRTLIVLVSLVAAMTVASGLLFLLEPTATTPTQGIKLSAVTPNPQFSQELLFDLDPRAQLAPWSSIIIQESKPSPAHPNQTASPSGSHFWIHSAPEGSDGRIVVGQRWRRQQPLSILPVTEPSPRSDNPTPDHAILIKLSCDPALHGPSDQQLHALIWLVHRLQARFSLPAHAVTYRFQDQPPGSSDPLFPVAWFRQQLLSYGTP